MNTDLEPQMNTDRHGSTRAKQPQTKDGRMSATQTAVILFNLGGPDDLLSVEPFLVNLFGDRDIIQLPGGACLQPWMARLIAKVRGPSVRDNYRKIGGGSPQLRITRQQASTLEDRLNFETEPEGGFRI